MGHFGCNVTIDGQNYNFFTVNPNNADGAYEYEGLTIIYENGAIVRISGSWFEITAKESHTVGVTVAENTTGKGRNLWIYVTWKVLPEIIKIHQKK